jgi:hypothetical protein
MPSLPVKMVKDIVNVSWGVVCPGEALLFWWGQFSPSLLAKMPSISSVNCWTLRWLQSKWLGAKTDTEIEEGMPSFSLAWIQVRSQCLSPKMFKHLL